MRESPGAHCAPLSLFLKRLTFGLRFKANPPTGHLRLQILGLCHIVDWGWGNYAARYREENTFGKRDNFVERSRGSKTTLRWELPCRRVEQCA